MRIIIALYIIRYGLQDTLTQIAEGIQDAVKSYEGKHAFTDTGLKELISAATTIYTIRNARQAPFEETKK